MAGEIFRICEKGVLGGILSCPKNRVEGNIKNVLIIAETGVSCENGIEDMKEIRNVGFYVVFSIFFIKKVGVGQKVKGV